MSRVLGGDVTYAPVEIAELSAALEKQGRSPHLIQHLGHVAIDYRNGVFSGTNNLGDLARGPDGQSGFGRALKFLENAAEGPRHVSLARPNDPVPMRTRMRLGESDRPSLLRHADHPLSNSVLSCASGRPALPGPRNIPLIDEHE